MKIEKHLRIVHDKTFFIVFPGNTAAIIAQKKTAAILGYECLYASKINH